jgi:acyl-CoA thioesterase FadM
MRWIRLFFALIAARYRSALTVNQKSVLNFRVWLTDIDVSIMNHAAMMTVMEAGRIDMMVRSGFFRLARKNRWYFPSSAISVQFIRPLKTFQKATLTTIVSHVCEDSIYLEQKITRREKLIAICIVKGTIKKGRETLNAREVMLQLGVADFPVRKDEFIPAFEKHNQLLREVGSDRRAENERSTEGSEPGEKEL